MRRADEYHGVLIDAGSGHGEYVSRIARESFPNDREMQKRFYEAMIRNQEPFVAMNNAYASMHEEFEPDTFYVSDPTNDTGGCTLYLKYYDSAMQSYRMFEYRVRDSNEKQQWLHVLAQYYEARMPISEMMKMIHTIRHI